MTTTAPAPTTTEVAPLRQLLETERAKNVLESTQSFLTSYYGKAKATLPQTAVEKLSTVEDAVAKRVTAEAVTGVIDTLDAALATINTRVENTRATINTTVVETSDRALTLRSQAVAAADSTVALQITRLEHIFDSILPASSDSEESEEEAEAGEEKDVEQKSAAAAAAAKPLPRVIKLSSRISKRLQKRAMKNMTALRERAETVQHVDLIQYAADYLDLDEKETRQRLASAKDFVATKALAVYSPIESKISKIAPAVATARSQLGEVSTQVSTQVDARVQEVKSAVDARRAAVVAHAKSFYALLAVEFIKVQDKTGAAVQDADAFAKKIKCQLGESWNDRFAAPTKTYFAYISAVWAETAADDQEQQETKSSTNEQQQQEEEKEEGQTAAATVAAVKAKIADLSAPARALSSHVDRFLRVITPQVNAAVGDAAKSLSTQVLALPVVQRVTGATAAGATKNDQEEDEEEDKQDDAASTTTTTTTTAAAVRWDDPG
eukprot:g5873.t1